MQYYHPGGTPKKCMAEWPGPQSIRINSISYNPTLSSVDGRVYSYISDNRKSDPAINVKALEQDKDKNPAQTKLALFHQRQSTEAPQFSSTALRQSHFGLDVFRDRWYHACLSHEEISIKYPQNM